eukprot:TRINITY_DN5832_c0_g1_i1.p1 TRINITY_DN5832_c0_g1~~TRINITY_DN5832_c0_g1_i1.p1  ORF type:complete len:370 (+),score=99.30 TRINITY_DN5832_c0_g1_i1:22-1110(+)
MASASGERMPLLRGVLSADTREDSSPLSQAFQTLRWLGGAVLSVFCIPLACFGCGPIVVIPQGFQGAVLRFGKFAHLVGPGTYNVNIGMETFLVKSVQVQMLRIPCQQALTKDNVSITLDAVVFFRIADLPKALFEVMDCESSVVNVAQSAMYTLLGEQTLQELFAHRAEITQRSREIVGHYTEPWGIEVHGIEIRDINVPPAMQRVMAAVAEAEREGQAKVVSAKADLQAAKVFAEAADVLGTNPAALQLRYFQTLTEIASEKSSTIIVPSEVTMMVEDFSDAISVSVWKYRSWRAAGLVPSTSAASANTLAACRSALALTTLACPSRSASATAAMTRCMAGGTLMSRISIPWTSMPHGSV